MLGRKITIQFNLPLASKGLKVRPASDAVQWPQEAVTELLPAENLL